MRRARLTFSFDSEGQWHAGWVNENLFELCTVDATRPAQVVSRFGLMATQPDDRSHGPQGPRNVLYNCDVISHGCAIWLGGMNEAWLFLHNRLVSDGYGIMVQKHSFDHVIRGNVILSRKGMPGICLYTADCIGIEIAGNILYGNTARIIDGPGIPGMVEGNRLLPLPADIPPRPAPAIVSIFDGQRTR